MIQVKNQIQKALNYLELKPLVMQRKELLQETLLLIQLVFMITKKSNKNQDVD